MAGLAKIANANATELDGGGEMNSEQLRTEMLSRQFRIQSSAAALLIRAVDRLSLEFDRDAKDIAADAKLWLFQHLYAEGAPLRRQEAAE
jgi:hypothetical protein